MNAKAEAAGPSGGSRIHTWKMEDMSLGQSIWIGFCQIFSAVFPGTSRSMSTIAGGQIAGMSRASALEFSFFVSIPTMAAATLYTLYKSLRGKGENPIGVSQIDAARVDRACHRLRRLVHRCLWSVAWFMAYVRKRGFAPFAVYRIIVGALVLVFAAKLSRDLHQAAFCTTHFCRSCRCRQDVAKQRVVRREAKWILQMFSCIVGTPASWHNVGALADCGAEWRISVFGV